MAKVTTTKPLLILLYGFPGAGKTYFARQLGDSLQTTHIQGDRIRHELFEQPRYDKQENGVVTHIMDYMAEQFLSAGLSVVYDANAMRTAQRRYLREMAKRTRAETLVVWVQIDVESAFGRVAGRDRRKADDKYAMSLDRTTFDSLNAHMQNPEAHEAYVVISGKHNFKTQQNSVLKRLREAGLVGGAEAADRVAKPGLINLIPNPLAGSIDPARRNITIR